jgi:hypothetical protein
MNDTRKRKICCGLSSCCGKTRSESAQMIAGKSSTQPLTMGQKCGNCCCWPFRKIGNPFKKRKVDSMDAKKKNMDSAKLSMWERICCCSGCCRRCKKGGDSDMENMKKVSWLVKQRMNVSSGLESNQRLCPKSECNLHTLLLRLYVRMQSYLEF